MYTCKKCTKQVPVVYDSTINKERVTLCEKCMYPGKCKHCKRILAVPTWDLCDPCLRFEAYKKLKKKLKKA